MCSLAMHAAFLPSVTVRLLLFVHACAVLQGLMNNISGGRVSVVWEAAPACPFSPTVTNSVHDRFGRFWSWHDGKSCAFKVRKA